jgi:hypothetical protein
MLRVPCCQRVESSATYLAHAHVAEFATTLLPTRANPPYSRVAHRAKTIT